MKHASHRQRSHHSITALLRAMEEAAADDRVDRCGTFGCVPPDEHPGLHCIPELPQKRKRRPSAKVADRGWDDDEEIAGSHVADEDDEQPVMQRRRRQSCSARSSTQASWTKGSWPNHLPRRSGAAGSAAYVLASPPP